MVQSMCWGPKSSKVYAGDDKGRVAVIYLPKVRCVRACVGLCACMCVCVCVYVCRTTSLVASYWLTP